MKDVVIVGTGGQGKGIADIARHAGRRVVGFVDIESAERVGMKIHGVPVVSVLETIEQDVDAEAVELVIGYGSTRRKKAIAEQLAIAYQFATLVSPDAHVEPTVKLGAGTVVHPMAVIMHDTVLGDHVKIDPQCVVAHDNDIGSYANLTPGCSLGGYVTVGEGAVLYMGSTIIPRIRVGAWSTVGAGAVVVRNVPAEVTVIGNPAKVFGWNKGARPKS